MEVCTPKDSNLSQAVMSGGGTARRVGLFNGYDLATRTGLQRVLHLCRSEKPRRVVFSPPCGADSSIQELNMLTPEGVRKVNEKRRKSRKIRANIRVVIEWLLRDSKDTHIDYEQPLTCRSWKCPTLSGLLEQTAACTESDALTPMS